MNFDLVLSALMKQVSVAVDPHHRVLGMAGGADRSDVGEHRSVDQVPDPDYRHDQTLTLGFTASEPLLPGQVKVLIGDLEAVRRPVEVQVDLLLTTLLGIGILTFVLVSANLLQAFELVARGVSPAVLGQFIAYMLPFALQFSIPLAVLCAAVLVFSRMSADHEVTAMRASGDSQCAVGIWKAIWLTAKPFTACR